MDEDALNVQVEREDTTLTVRLNGALTWSTVARLRRWVPEYLRTGGGPRRR